MAEPIVCKNPECKAVDKVTVYMTAWGSKSWDPLTGFGELEINDAETNNIVCAECGGDLDVWVMDLVERNGEEAAKRAKGEKQRGYDRC